MFQIAPHIFDGVEIRRIARQAFQLEPLRTTTRQELLDDPAEMDRRAVPDHQDLAWDVLQQMLQKAHHCLTAIRPPLHAHQKPTLRRQRADGGHMITRHGNAQDRRLTSWCVGADPRREQVEAGFIYPDDRLLPRGSVFLSSGQRSSHQAWITVSSRWAARTMGFWTLKPKARSKRLTCAR
jgi:hypothetical protein